MILLLAACRLRITPDVIVLTVDTLRADRVGFMGHAAAHTPAMDGLAASGRVYEQATTPFPRTTPALGSLMTGLLPVHHGSREVGDAVGGDRRLATLLSDAGWQTLAVSAIRVAGPEQRLDLGFDTFELHHDAPAPAIARATSEAVGRADGDRPLFLWVHFADPHFPYLPEGKKPAESARCRTAGEAAAAGRLQRAVLFTNRDGVAAQLVDACRALYDGEVAWADAGIAAVLSALDRTRGRRPRYVVLTADHGENQGENGLFFEHGPNLADAAVRVPLVLAGPGVEPGRDSDVARLEDVMPTLLDLVGVPVPPDLDGVSLVGPRAPFARVESGGPLLVGMFAWLVSGKGDRWCVNEGPYSWCALGRRPATLYDHVADPDLKHDVAADHPTEAARLAAAAGRWKPGAAHLREVRTPDAALVRFPTVDGWADRAPDGSAADEALAASLAAWSAEVDGGGAGVPVTPDEGLRQLGYVE